MTDNNFKLNFAKLAIHLGSINTDNAMLDQKRILNAFEKFNILVKKFSNEEFTPTENDKLVVDYFANTFAPIFESVIKDAQKLNAALDEFETDYLFTSILEEGSNV